ncbi:HAD family hydrolase [Micromonospora aurantiaca]|uniref:HAD family hydrolase n=2 Tax=Micromonospora aurantiaca (nom. illeg.) TaxID=47850 RepID=A0A3M9JYM9_9ACTN|nr:HAD family hydrolase [Micromonospora aurantiaca]ADL45392.1 HAD-superfamily hydrolase, subfamily IA, variant 3 [Micromonospora aurantiaca ATCC 27029]AXH94538.1 HAD family hydrolase [Micromonospora aurantiaca]RNH93764.1 HAD family hydrolase [Micromonospora aurantiaca]
MIFDVDGYLFDLDGTLVDSVFQHAVGWKVALDSVGISVPTWRVRQCVGLGAADFLRRVSTRPVDPDELSQLRAIKAAVFAQMSASVGPFDRAVELLATLRARRMPWAVATSGERSTAGPLLERLAIAPSDVVVTLSEVGRAKPWPDLFLAAAESLSVDVRRTAVVGDSVWDMQAATAAGAVGVGVRSGGADTAELMEAGAVAVFDDVAALLDRLLKQ